MKLLKKTLLLLLFFFAGSSFAQKTVKHKVVSGDSFYSIAKKYDVKEEAIYQLNPKLKGTVLQLNTIIIIPNGKRKIQNGTAFNKNLNSDVYEVQSGDSFYSISKNKNVPIEDLKIFNPEVSPEKLQVGGIIYLKKNKNAKDKSAVVLTNNSKKIALSALDYHVVSKGETLHKIALLYNLKVSELIEINNFTNTAIQIGQKIQLKKSKDLVAQTVEENEIVADACDPDDVIEEADDSGEITHLVVKGETLSSVARLYNVTLKQLKRINPRVGNNLSVGHKLIIKKGVVAPVLVEDDFVEEIAPMSFENLSKADQLIAIASDRIGTRYRGGGKTQEGFDCSGLMCYTFDQLAISLPRSSASQSEIGKKIKRKNAQRGDLIFFTTNGRGSINHVGLITEVYDDDIKFVHSSVSSGVIISSINEAYYSKRFKKIVRILVD